MRPITFYVMAERHGGEKPRFLPYGERSEASPRKNFTAGERWRFSARERSEGARSSAVERPPYTRKVSGSNPDAPTAGWQNWLLRRS